MNVEGNNRRDLDSYEEFNLGEVNEVYYYLTAIGLTSGGSITVHIYTQTVHRIQRTEHT
jgi:hypothetical protein